MKASKFTEAQKAFILKQGEEGTPVAEICRKAGISQATSFNGKKRYGGLLPDEMRRLKALEDENSRLQKIVAVLSKLCHEIVWPSDLVVPDGGRMVVIASNRMLSPFAIKPSAHGHQPDMLLIAVGRVYLALSSQVRRSEIIDAIRRENPGHRMLQDEVALTKLLQETRRSGYGVRSEYKPDAFGAVAVPVLVQDEPIACLNLFYYKSAISRENLVAEHLSKLLAAADEIVRRLSAGYGVS